MQARLPWIKWLVERVKCGGMRNTCPPTRGMGDGKVKTTGCDLVIVGLRKTPLSSLGECEHVAFAIRIGRTSIEASATRLVEGYQHQHQRPKQCCWLYQTPPMMAL